MYPNTHGRRALKYNLSEGEWEANELMTGIDFKGLIAQWSVFSLVRSHCSYKTPVITWPLNTYRTFRGKKSMKDFFLYLGKKILIFKYCKTDLKRKLQTLVE